MKELRLAFAGTPTFAATILERLLQSGRQVQRALTQPPRRSGRGRKLTKSPVQQLCENEGIDVRMPRRGELEPKLLADVDLLVVAAYGLLIPAETLDAPRLGCINVHASLLPRWRGASPVEHAIMHGDDETGVSIMQVTPKLDAGPVYKQAKFPLSNAETTMSLTSTLAELGASTLLDVITSFEQEAPMVARPQDPSGVTYAPRLDAAAAKISWTRPAAKVARFVRAMHGRTGAFTQREDIRVKILAAEPVCGTYKPGVVVKDRARIVVGCGKGGLALQRVQLNRGKGAEMSALDAANGYPQVLGTGIEFDLG